MKTHPRRRTPAKETLSSQKELKVIHFQPKKEKRGLRSDETTTVRIQHPKGKKQNRSSTASKRRREDPEEHVHDEDLERFAGSSEDEGEEEAYDYQGDLNNKKNNKDLDEDEEPEPKKGEVRQKVIRERDPNHQERAEFPRPVRGGPTPDHSFEPNHQPLEDDMEADIEASSVEDDEHDDDDDDDGDEEEEQEDDKGEQQLDHADEAKMADHDDDVDDDDELDGEQEDDDEEDADPYHQSKKVGSLGMSQAMLRILGASAPPPQQQQQHRPWPTPSKSAAANPPQDRRSAQPAPSGTSVVVLSKTKTPLQRLAEQERQERIQLQEKRRMHLEQRLSALHVPFSVATTAHPAASGSASGVAREWEQERTHRRVATRGVVALFNAIALHQHPKAVSSSSSSSSSRPPVPAEGNPSTGEAVGMTTTASKGDATKMTKYSFLDMIKNKALASGGKASTTQNHHPLVTHGKTSSKAALSSHSTPTDSPWKALQDDYMMNPQKNWDQETSDDDGHEVDAYGDEPEDQDDQDHRPASAKRVRRVVHQ